MTRVLFVAACLLAAVGVTSAPATSRHDVAGTAACLAAQPGAVDALPPATSPAAPILYVYVQPQAAYAYPPGARHLWAWAGSGAAESLAGAHLIFFRDSAGARRYRERDARGTGELARNVLVQWEHGRDATGTFGRLVRSCLGRSGATPPPQRPLPRADLATFGGSWGGHTRRLVIGPGGRGLEIVDDGCCVRTITLSFRLVRAGGTIRRATATFRVTAVRDWDAKHRPRVGQIGRLVLENGVVTESLSGVYFCSDPAWAATGACGA